ncbi:CpsD/CapB family tyrosine-protein kinase [Tessaracoccus lubricantis]|uniref:CpsD/CapB family tyrosine-protein kinase n=1 Tax=Tessaracoccus lubricantis TaxID=545543 RepID=UPI0031E506E5
MAQITDASVLAEIGHHDKPVAGRAAGNDGVQWASAESYRKLRTSIGFVGLGGERRSSMVITSSVEGEGKTETATNLARVLALAGERVLLIDADFRRPQVGERLRLDSELGLSDVLTGRGSLQDLVIDVAPGYLSVLPAGTIPPNPSELLGSEAMGHLLSTVERQYDYVLLDAPPLLPVTDAVVLAAEAGGAVVVSRSGTVRRQQLAAALDVLESADATLLGVVLNDVPASHSDTYGYYYTAKKPVSV